MEWCDGVEVTATENRDFSVFLLAMYRDVDTESGVKCFQACDSSVSRCVRDLLPADKARF